MSLQNDYCAHTLRKRLLLWSSAQEEKEFGTKVRLIHDKIRVECTNVRLIHDKIRVDCTKVRLIHDKIRVDCTKVRLIHDKIRVEDYMYYSDDAQNIAN